MTNDPEVIWKAYFAAAFRGVGVSDTQYDMMRQAFVSGMFAALTECHDMDDVARLVSACHMLIRLTILE